MPAPEWSWLSGDLVVLIALVAVGGFILLPMLVASASSKSADGDERGAKRMGRILLSLEVVWVVVIFAMAVAFLIVDANRIHPAQPPSFAEQVESSFNVSSFSCDGCDANPKTSPLPNGVDASWMSDGKAYRGMVMSEGTKVGLYVTQGDGGLVPFDRTGVDG